MADDIRGNAAWKAEVERIAQRNADASKRGKKEREDREHAEAVQKRERELRADAGLNTKFH